MSVNNNNNSSSNNFTSCLNSNCFGEKEMLTDALSSQKFATENYNTFANECSNPAVKNEFMNILNEEHQIQFEVFSEMQKRGWYAVQQAEQQKVSQAKQKYKNS
ncbi:MAG: spore coat protein [Oscillospiraceae bacterium]|nr:spore coat protein [Oscillospiraceae bacterium]